MSLGRFIAIGLPVIAAGLLALYLLTGGKAPTETYRVDALFDTAKGVIPGQLVKIAGARVGAIEDVKLTPDYKARIQMSVDPRFAPFRTDARCSIQPEGLIAENFVQCEPGTPDAPQLRARDGHVPTVPVANTTVPINLTDLFNVFRTPVRQRFSMLVATLGLGTATRGAEFNDILRRANPTLQLVRRATGVINRQRRALAATVVATDHVVAQLTRRRHRVQDLLDRSARVTQVTADHRRPLAESIRRMPPLLDEVHPLAARLHVLTRDSTPVLRDLRRAAPYLRRLIDDLEPAAAAGRPALHSLRPAAQQGRQTIQVGRRTVELLRQVADDLQPINRVGTELLVDLRANSVSENLVRFAYFGTAVTSRFDEIGHTLPNHLSLSNPCSLPATTPVDGCNTFYRGGDRTMSPDLLGITSADLATLGLADDEDGARGDRGDRPGRGRGGRRNRDGDLASEVLEGVAPAGDGAAEDLLNFLLG